MTEGSFEAKLTAKRETAAGIYLTVQVQPDDYVADLATLRVGSILMLGWAEIVNTEVEEITADPKTLAEELTGISDIMRGKSTKPEPKDRHPFSSLPLSQQCGIRCADKQFQDYICNVFWNTNVDEPTEDYTTLLVKNHLCIESRSELDKENNVYAVGHWIDLEGRYQAHLTDQKYAGARR